MRIHDLIKSLESAAEKYGRDADCQVWIHVSDSESSTSRELPEFENVPSPDGTPSIAIDFSGTSEIN